MTIFFVTIRRFKYRIATDNKFDNVIKRKLELDERVIQSINN